MNIFEHWVLRIEPFNTAVLVRVLKWHRDKKSLARTGERWVIVDPGTDEVYRLCNTDRNKSQIPESETRVTKRGRKERVENEGNK